MHITRLARAIFDKKPTRVELVFTGTIVDGKFNPSAEITDLMYCSIDEWPDGMPNDQKKLIKEILAKP